MNKLSSKRDKLYNYRLEKMKSGNHLKKYGADSEKIYN